MSESGLSMPVDEIVVRYRQAKDRNDQVRKLAELNAVPVERIISILIGAGFDHRCFSNLRRKMNAEERAALEQMEKAETIASSKKKPKAAKVAEKMEKVLHTEKKTYKKPEIIPEPPKKETFPTLEQAVAAIKAQIAEINRQQYELDMKRANLYCTLEELLGEAER